MTALAHAVIRPRARAAAVAYDAALVVGGSLFIAGLAQVAIPLPFTPVPITGQTLGVLLVGTAYGWLPGGLTVALYLAEIALGLPFAAEGEGGLEALTLAKASGGYLWGFLLGAIVMGALANRGWDRRLRSSISVMLVGSVLVYLIGIPWLAASVDVPVVSGSACDLASGAGCDALELGLYPFVIGDTIKLLVAAGLLPAAWRLVGRRDD